MTPETPIAIAPRMEEALGELQRLIRRAYPDAAFTVGRGEDPEGIYLTAVVDVDDRGQVIDLFLERLLELQVDDGLPLFVVPVRPPARNAALINQPDPIGAYSNL